MTVRTYPLLLLALAPALLGAQEVPAAPPSPVTRLALSPAAPVVAAGDTLRLSARALDAAGNPVPDAAVRFQKAGGWFEGDVDSTGLVTSGSTGTLQVAVVALVPGAKPYIERVSVRMVPGAAALIEVSPDLATLVVGQRLTLVPGVFTALGDRRSETPAWSSSAPGVVRVSKAGVVTSLKPGTATITARAGSATWSRKVTVRPNDIATFEISPANVEARTGDVIRFALTAKDAAGRPVEGLTPTWSFSPGQGAIDDDGAFVGYEPGDYTVTASFGARSAEATVTLAPRDVRRPATVVGRLPRTAFTTEEVWIHPNGKIAYLGTGGGGDRMYALDISDPAEAGRHRLARGEHPPRERHDDDAGRQVPGVHPRRRGRPQERHRDLRRSSDPAHPKAIAEFTEGVTGGVHSAFVYKQDKYGTHVFLTNDGTGAMHVIDINDPYKPKEVGAVEDGQPARGRPHAARHRRAGRPGVRQLLERRAGHSRHRQRHEGRQPVKPVLVSQFKYDLNDMYREVEAAGGPGFIRGTHTAWRHRKYVFIADEVFPAAAVKGAKDAVGGPRVRPPAGDRRERPRSSRSRWRGTSPSTAACTTSGWRATRSTWAPTTPGSARSTSRASCSGDLRAQEREMVHVNTADMDGPRARTPP